MLSFLSGFFLFNLLYHIIVTIGTYGIELFSPNFPALFREGIWCCCIFIIFLLNYKQWRAYRKKRKRSWITCITMIIFAIAISYLLLDKSINDIIIGIKYGFRRIAILLSATSIGFFYQNKFNNPKIIKQFKRFLIITVIWGFLWQIAKLISPEFFWLLWYELKLDDFHFWEKPPLYYLTWYEGTLRRQGIFSGPNNYGYFLIAFFPTILLFFWERIKNIKQINLWQRINISIIILWIVAILLTLSRSAILGGILILIIVNRKYIKTKKKLLIWGGIVLVIIIALLSALKRDSTLGHITQKLWAIPQIINHPLGYGLGSSGPAIHHNGTLLPENYYFQIMLDTGTIGFLLWAIVIFQILGIQYHIKKTFTNKTVNEHLQIQYILLQRMQIGFLGLLCIGMLLHVFEDSMVNYLFFSIYGILLGSLSKEIPGKVKLFFPNKKSLKSE